MMKLGYSAATAGIYDLSDAFRLAETLELQFIELNFEVFELLPEMQSVSRARELSRATGIGLSLHLPFVDLNIASPLPAARQSAIERTKRALEYGAAIGASCGVLHTGLRYPYHPLADEATDAALADSLEALKNPPIPIAVENLACKADGVVREPEMLKDIVDKAGFQCCIDFGHAHVESTQPWRPEARRGEDLVGHYLRTLGERVIHLHLNGNDGLNDLHLATCDGTLALEPYADYFRTFKGTICLEVAGGGESVRRSARHVRSLTGQATPLNIAN